MTLYLSKMKQVEVQKIEINVSLQINTHNVGSVEINDTTNLVCNCSKALFVYYFDIVTIFTGHFYVF